MYALLTAKSVPGTEGGSPPETPLTKASRDASTATDACLPPFAGRPSVVRRARAAAKLYRALRKCTILGVARPDVGLAWPQIGKSN